VTHFLIPVLLTTLLFLIDNIRIDQLASAAHVVLYSSMAIIIGLHECSTCWR